MKPTYNKFKVSKKEDRTLDGIVFDSKLESRIYQGLCDILGAGNFHLQPRFELQPGFVDVTGKKQRPIEYVADFLLGPPRLNSTDPLHPDNMVIDSKGMRDSVFKLKLKMFLLKYKFPLHEVRSLKGLKELQNDPKFKPHHE